MGENPKPTVNPASRSPKQGALKRGGTTSESDDNATELNLKVSETDDIKQYQNGSNEGAICRRTKKIGGRSDTVIPIKRTAWV